MYVEPVINLNDFKIDYFKGLSAKELKEKYNITPRQYRILIRENKLSRDYSFLKKNPHFQKKKKYYTKTDSGKYLVRKVIGTQTISYGSYFSEKVAQHIVEELKKEHWNKKQLKMILEEMKEEEWYMNLANQKIHALQCSIEVEKKQNKVNWERINKLEKKLKNILKEVE